MYCRYELFVLIPPFASLCSVDLLFFFALPRRSYFQCSFSPTPQHDCQDENVIKNLNRVRGESEKAFINFFETLLPSSPTASQPYLHLHHTPESHNKSSILIIKEDNFAENALKIDLDEAFISNTSLPVFGRIELIRFGRSDDISFRLLDLMRSIANESMTRRRKLQAIHENEKTF